MSLAVLASVLHGAVEAAAPLAGADGREGDDAARVAAKLRVVGVDTDGADSDVMRHNGRSLLGPGIPFNLRCAAGHRHWSPTPELYVGTACLRGEGRTSEGMLFVLGKCRETMMAHGR